MNVVAFNGSMRKDGNTAILLRTVLHQLEKRGIETELIQLAGERIRGCQACGECSRNQNKHCAITYDCVNECIDRMLVADGIILGSPVYFSNVTAEMKALIDRAGYVIRANGDLLQRKVGAAVVAVRRAGAIHVFNSMNHFFLISQMIIPGSSYWNIGIGRQIGDVEHDQEGLRTMIRLGENMAWLLHKLKGK
ncbi:MAG: flavodoxin family protein [Candidatus Cloacimonetes bacterium]|nr:flavodoxin family protein [Candidatus Cloacimonadota bacterium]